MIDRSPLPQVLYKKSDFLSFSSEVFFRGVNKHSGNCDLVHIYPKKKKKENAYWKILLFLKFIRKEQLQLRIARFFNAVLEHNFVCNK